MIRLFVYTILVVSVGLALTLVLAREPGYLLVSYGPYSFETSLFALLVAVLFVVVAWKVLTAFLSWINPLKLFRSGREWLQARAQKRENQPVKTEAELQAEVLLELQALSDSDGVGLAELKKFWKKAHKKYGASSLVVGAYVDALLLIGESKEAVAVLDVSLQKNWAASLLAQYAIVSLSVDSALAVKQMQRAETWLDLHGNDAELLLALGRLSLRNELWGKAREYFERCLKLSNSPETFAELARLLLNLKEQTKSADYLRMQTKLVSSALPAFPQPGIEKTVIGEKNTGLKESQPL